MIRRHPQGADPPPLDSFSVDGEAARALGRLEAKVAAIEDQLERQDAAFLARMTTIERKLDTMATTLAQSMGAIKLAHWLAGAAVAGIGFLASLLFPSSK
jgi:hypothetical protein